MMFTIISARRLVLRLTPLFYVVGGFANTTIGVLRRTITTMRGNRISTMVTRTTIRTTQTM